MLVGVPKEIKDHECRVGLIPSTVRELVSKGHRVLVETGAGHGAGIGDDDYAAAGAEIVSGADQVFDRAELTVKVKEPLAEERKKLKRGQILFTYLPAASISMTAWSPIAQWPRL
jgi:alanine dehydrogenase